MIEEGKYLAKVKSHNIVENKKNALQVAITFEIPNKGDVTYWGGFSDEGKKYTIANLITCGLHGSNPANDLDYGREVEVVIKHETYEGKTRAKVKYINPVGGSKNVITTDAAKARLSHLESAVMAARQEMGVELSAADELGF